MIEIEIIFFYNQKLRILILISISERRYFILGKGKKKCKSVVFYQIGGGVTQNQTLFAKTISFSKIY